MSHLHTCRTYGVFVTFVISISRVDKVAIDAQ